MLFGICQHKFVRVERESTLPLTLAGGTMDRKLPKVLGSPAEVLLAEPMPELFSAKYDCLYYY